jgi:hypothetical protein
VVGAANALTGAAKAMQWWWLFAVAVYLVVGALLGRRVGQPSSFFQAILITALWILFWPLMLLFMDALGMIWAENDGARNGDERLRATVEGSCRFESVHAA